MWSYLTTRFASNSRKHVTWRWPLKDVRPLVPEAGEPGAFGTVRKYDTHTGVDLYCPENTLVVAVESGRVVSVERFTGEAAESPWWLETWAVLVSGASGVVAYGELHPPTLKHGQRVRAGQRIGAVARVLVQDKGRPLSMLHLELYTPGTTTTVWWRYARPENLLDPTPFLLTAK